MKDGGCRALFLPQRTPDHPLTDMHGLYAQKNKQHTRPRLRHPPSPWKTRKIIGVPHAPPCPISPPSPSSYPVSPLRFPFRLPL